MGSLNTRVLVGLIGCEEKSSPDTRRSLWAFHDGHFLAAQIPRAVSPLQYAVMRGDVEYALELIERDSHCVDSVEFWGRTALHIELGADLEAADSRGDTSLHLAAAKSNWISDLSVRDHADMSSWDYVEQLQQSNTGNAFSTLLSEHNKKLREVEELMSDHLEPVVLAQLIIEEFCTYNGQRESRDNRECIES